MTIQIVTDSTADLPDNLIKEYQISVVPLYVNIKTTNGLESLRDGVDIDHTTFYQTLANNDNLPTTSQPSAQDFYEVYKPMVDAGSQIISIHVSSKLSATYNAASQAKAMIGPNAPIEIVDSQQVSVGLGLIVLKAAQAIKETKELNDIASLIENIRNRIEVYVAVDTLDFLQKGGRIGKAAAFLGSVLKLKPILTMDEGEVRPLERVRTRIKAINRLAHLASSGGPIEDLFVFHNTTPEDCQSLQDTLTKQLPLKTITVCRLGPVVGTHAGPGAIGLGFLKS
jgi:DegV family protein with EDD domain